MNRRLRAAAALAIFLLPFGCATRELAGPSQPDFSLSHASDAGKFQVTIRPLVDPAPLNQIHSWEIRLANHVGEPVPQAAVYIGGGMPEHGHGFPTAPRVVRETAPGTYLLEGMKFNMHGRWEIKVAIQAGTVFDIATFNTMVPLAPATR